MVLSPSIPKEAFATNGASRDSRTKSSHSSDERTVPGRSPVYMPSYRPASLRLIASRPLRRRARRRGIASPGVITADGRRYRRPNYTSECCKMKSKQSPIDAHARTDPPAQSADSKAPISMKGRFDRN